MSELDADIPPPLPDRRRLIVEAVVIAMVGVVPHAMNSLVGYLSGTAESSTEIIASYVGHIGSSMGIIAVALFIAWSNPEGVRAFGLHRFRFMDVAHAIAVAAAAFAAYLVYWNTIAPIYWAVNSGEPEQQFVFTGPSTISEYAVTSIALMFNGAAEELVLWSVLFTRLVRLWDNTVATVVFVAAVFASYHLYQGVFAMGGVACMGLIFGGYFAWRGRIWPLIIAHALWDLLLII